MIDDDIVRFYEQGREQDRLAHGVGTLELARTQELLRRFLPPPPADLLDVGGGPGVYAAWLAHAGYRVHLVDPVPLPLRFAWIHVRCIVIAVTPGCWPVIVVGILTLDAALVSPRGKGSRGCLSGFLSAGGK